MSVLSRFLIVASVLICWATPTHSQSENVPTSMKWEETAQDCRRNLANAKLLCARELILVDEDGRTKAFFSARREGCTMYFQNNKQETSVVINSSDVQNGGGPYLCLYKNGHSAQLQVNDLPSVMKRLGH